MGRVSKRTINTHLQQEVENQLSTFLASVNNKQEVAAFLREFLTPEEKIMLGKRLILFMMLHKNLTSAQIYSSLHFSYETVRWYRELFQTKSELFRKHIQRLITRERNKELWKKIEKAFEPLDLAFRARHDMKARAKLARGEFWKEDGN